MTVRQASDSRAMRSSRCVPTTGAPRRQGHGWVAAGGEYEGATLMSMPLWGMASKPLQAAQAGTWQELVTVEDHLADCGFGSWMAESLAGHGEAAGRLRIRALDPAVCGMVGSQAALNKAGGL